MSILIVPPSFDDPPSENPCKDIVDEYPVPSFDGHKGKLVYKNGPICGVLCNNCEDVHMYCHIKAEAFANLGSLHWSASEGKYIYKLGSTGWDCFADKDTSWQYAKVLLQAMLLRTRSASKQLVHQKQIVNGSDHVQIGPFSITIFTVKIECTDDQMKLMILNKVINIIIDALDN